MEENKEFDVDEALARIEEINRQLSTGKCTLQESLDLYKEGTELAAKCQEKLTIVEKQLEIINEQDA